MIIKLPTGIILKDDEGMAPNLQQYAADKGLKNVRVFMTFEGLEQWEDLDKVQGVKCSYVIVLGNSVEFESQSAEAIAVHLDIMALHKQLEV